MPGFFRLSKVLLRASKAETISRQRIAYDGFGKILFDRFRQRQLLFRQFQVFAENFQGVVNAAIRTSATS